MECVARSLQVGLRGHVRLLPLGVAFVLAVGVVVYLFQRQKSTRAGTGSHSYSVASVYDDGVQRDRDRGGTGAQDGLINNEAYAPETAYAAYS